MKRFIISLSLILVFIIGAILFDHFYMKNFSLKMNDRIDRVEASIENGEKSAAAMEALNDAFSRNRAIVGQLVFSNRLEEVESLISKLEAGVKAGDQGEIALTIAELRARMRLLSSSWLYYRNQKYN